MDIAAEFLEKLNGVCAEFAAIRGRAIQQLPAAGYAVPMIVDCAEVRANDAVDQVGGWGAATFSVIFRTLLSALDSTMEREQGREEPFRLFFNSSQEIDPTVDRFLGLEHAILLIQNERVGIVDGLYTLESIGGRFRVSLSSPRRRNALTLLQSKASFIFGTDEQRELLNGLNNDKITDQDSHREHLVELTLRLDMSEIDVLRKGLPQVWQDLLSGLVLQDAEILTFLAFTVKLPDMLFHWLSMDALFKLCNAFATTYGRDELSRESFEKLMDILSSDLGAAHTAGTSVPFIRFGDWVRAWPFSYHTMLPELVFVTAVQNKQPKLWSNTFGSGLALAAVHLASRLAPFDNLIIKTLRRKSGVGDIDLAIYDKKTHRLLLCEIKTVFDKFRTDFQLSNFAVQKVNFEKARQQLIASQDAIASGAWKMEDIFGHDVKQPPSKIDRMLVLWRDQMNPTLDTTDPIPVVTFDTFVYLFSESKGDLAEFVDTIRQLEQVFWVSRHVDDFFSLGDGQVLVSRELEMDMLPPLSFLNRFEMTGLAFRELGTLRHLPENWREQMAARGEEVDFHFVASLSSQ